MAARDLMTAPNLKRLRQWQLLSQRDLAEKAGVAPRTVASLELGGAARFVTLRKLAAALGATAEELLGAEAAEAERAG